MPPAYLERLNDDQRAAVEHGVGGVVTGPLLLVAGAGSGKTNTLAHRVAHLIVHGADPGRILLMTFSRRAAADMTQRAQRIVGQVLADGQSRRATPPSLPWAGTFHGIGARLLRRYADQLGLDPSFTIHDREDSGDLLNLVRHDLGLSSTEKRFPAKGTCLSIYSRTVNEEADLKDVLDRSFPWCSIWLAELTQLFGGYVEAKQAQNVLDYDDLLTYWAAALEAPDVAAHMSALFDHILVDEYQDTNRVQATILHALKPDGTGLTVVGDDAQSIYSFRAATVRNILDFPRQFSAPATVLTLPQNYRSTAAILAASNEVIALAAERHTKDLWTDRTGGEKPALVSVEDETAQANYVADRILAQREMGVALRQQAVLFRASHHSAPLELELGRRKIPFVKFGGLKFLDTAHVKDVLAVLRLKENPRDRIAGFRALQLLPGIGPSTSAALLARLEGADDRQRILQEFDAPERAREYWPTFATLLSEPTAWPTELERVRLMYEPHLERLHGDVQARRNDLLQLEQIGATYPSRERFLTELTLDPPDATSDDAVPPMLDEDYLILSTIHSAKGQEWSAVFVLNTVDGCIPSDLGVGTSEEVEEERRLLYVAMTRAKDTLHLVVPQRFYVTGQARGGDRHVYAQRTRFIPEAMLDKFTRTVWRSPHQEMPIDRSRGEPVDLRARMRKLRIDWSRYRTTPTAHTTAPSTD